MSSAKPLSELYHVAFGKNPVSDAFAGTVTSDVVNMKNFHSCHFLVYWGVGTTGTFTITVEASDDVSGTNVTAIPYKYRVITGAIDAGDTHGALTDATSTGFTTTAGSHQCVIVDVDAEELGDTGYNYIRLKTVEVVDAAVLGGILILQGRPRYGVTTSTLT